MGKSDLRPAKTERIEQAVTCFQDGYYCSQAILSTYASEMDLPVETALKLASGFGGGMARQGKTCGAVTGAIMAIGLKHGSITPDDSCAEEVIYAKIKRLTTKMEDLFHTTVCSELVGYDIATTRGYEAAQAADVFNQLCPGFVRAVAEILEELL